MARAQSVPDSVIRLVEPYIVRIGPLVPLQLWGGQVMLGTIMSQTEKHIVRKSGREKVVFKDRILSVGPGFYTQKYLHTNVFLTADYAFVRRSCSGFYRQFSPLVGVSRTFLNDVTYTVDASGTVGRDKTAGDWRVMAGFATGIGKQFDSHKPTLLRDVFLTLNVPLFYPNFRSAVLKPSLQLGASFTLNGLHHTLDKTVKTIRR